MNKTRESEWKEIGEKKEKKKETDARGEGKKGREIRWMIG